MAAAGSSASKISLVTRNRLSRRRVLPWRDDDASCRSLPAAKGYDLGMLGQRGVDDAALEGIHRFEFNLDCARDTLGRPVCEFFQRHAPSLAVALHIHNDVCFGTSLSRDHQPQEQLHGV